MSQFNEAIKNLREVNIKVDSLRGKFMNFVVQEVYHDFACQFIKSLILDNFGSDDVYEQQMILRA